MAHPAQVSARPALRRSYKVDVFDPPPDPKTPGRLRRRFSVSERTAAGARTAALARIKDPQAKASIASDKGTEKIVIYLSKVGA